MRQKTPVASSRVAELAAAAARLGVAEDQVARDHLVSSVLAALAAAAFPVHFYGGTTLCRTYLDGSRLSEDVDLLHEDPAEGLSALGALLARALRREYPGAELERSHRDGDGVVAFLHTEGGVRLKVFVGSGHRYHPEWRFAPTAVALRYAGLPSHVELSCPTLSTFAAMKAHAYMDRFAPRDLYDLAGLAELGALDDEAEAILRRSAGHGFIARELTRVPDSVLVAWERELAHQVAQPRSAAGCAAAVASALAARRSGRRGSRSQFPEI